MAFRANGRSALYAKSAASRNCAGSDRGIELAELQPSYGQGDAAHNLALDGGAWGCGAMLIERNTQRLNACPRREMLDPLPQKIP
jgi:hypothetical protein